MAVGIKMFEIIVYRNKQSEVLFDWVVLNKNSEEELLRFLGLSFKT